MLAMRRSLTVVESAIFPKASRQSNRNRLSRLETSSSIKRGASRLELGVARREMQRAAERLMRVAS